MAAKGGYKITAALLIERGAKIEARNEVRALCIVLHMIYWLIALILVNLFFTLI